MKKAFWLFVVSWMKKSFIDEMNPSASAAVDCCLYIEDYLITEYK